MFVSMIALGNWQMRRLAWKLDLIETVETRAFADPVPAPEGEAPEYLRVSARGIFAHDLSLRVKAVTELGPGYWIMTPLTTTGLTLWINRGFVPGTLERDAWRQPEGTVEVTGLVRLDQPGGTLLERNQPLTGRWVSADLAEMSEASGLDHAEIAYFIDAEAHADADAKGPDASWPRGGLTRLTFRNTHLIYAMTWYAMAVLFFFAMAYVIRERLMASD